MNEEIKLRGGSRCKENARETREIKKDNSICTTNLMNREKTAQKMKEENNLEEEHKRKKGKCGKLQEDQYLLIRRKKIE